MVGRDGDVGREGEDGEGEDVGAEVVVHVVGHAVAKMGTVAVEAAAAMVIED